jgi:hypothetical protein
MMGREGDVTESERMKWTGNGGAMHVCGSVTTITGNTLSGFFKVQGGQKEYMC